MLVGKKYVYFQRTGKYFSIEIRNFLFFLWSNLVTQILETCTSWISNQITDICYIWDQCEPIYYKQLRVNWTINVNIIVGYDRNNVLNLQIDTSSPANFK